MSKFLIIGYGSVGTRHARNLHALGHHVVAADPFCAVPTPGDGPALFYRSWERALSDHADSAGCVIASPTSEHIHQLADVMVSAGLPVFCEKPLVAVEHVDWIHPDNLRDKCVVNFQYFFHPAMPAVEKLAHRHREIVFRGQDDLLARYGPSVGDVMCAHPIASALRFFGPALSVHLVSNGVTLDGYITHVAGQTSHFNFSMDRGPRESWVSAGGSSVALGVDDGMYRDCMAAWISWLAGGERDQRLSSLADGLAVTQVLAAVARVETMV